MEPFLATIARDLTQRFSDLSRICVVVPNRRAGLFLLQHLEQELETAGRTSWMPEVLPIEHLFYRLAEAEPADSLTLLFQLYRAYTRVHPEPEPFDAFYYWGELMLKDFRDIDQFLVDPELLYTELREEKEALSDFSFLEPEQVELIRQFWTHFRAQAQSENQGFLQYWQYLAPLYRAFKEQLAAANLHEGAALYRQVATRLEELPAPEKQHIFVGFNAFTMAEERLIKHYITQHQALIFWDVDAYYLEDRQQEAGLFFRQYRKDPVFGPTFPSLLPDHIRAKAPHIHCYASSLKTMQAQLVGDILAALPEGQKWQETVVILPDEQLLFPVLHALPEQVDKVNVTMGYPVKNAPIYAFLEACVELQGHMREQEGEWVCYHQPLRDLLRSVYLKDAAPEFVDLLLKEMLTQNRVYLPLSRLQAGGARFERVFQRVEPGNLALHLADFVRFMAEELQGDTFQQAYLFQCYKQLLRLDDTLRREEIPNLELRFFIRLFRQLFREVKLPFDGEPLGGLQLMGVLESRNLDFKRLIICDLNEASFPPSGGLNSMIPYKLRKAFRLPVQEQNDAIYAYTFYRLLHQAEEVHLIYAQQGEGGKLMERSRYLEQLRVELPLEAEERQVFLPVGRREVPEIRIEKTPEVRAQLQGFLGRKARKRFSATAFSTYLDCRLRFYFKYVAELKEPDQVQEEVDAGVFGNLAHYSLEFLYLGYRERKKSWEITAEAIQELKKNWVRPAVEKAIRKHYDLAERGEIPYSGQLLVVREVLEHYVQAVLDRDAAAAPFQLIGLEVRCETEMPILVDGRKVEVALQGVIDRVDALEAEGLRLLDYKSGADKKDFPSVASLFDREDPKRNKAVMQTFFYGYLYRRVNPSEVRPLKPGLINLKDIFKPQFSPYLQLKEKPRGSGLLISDYRQYAEAFEEGLGGLLEEIFAAEQAFSQTDDLKKCGYCPYKALCGRN